MKESKVTIIINRPVNEVFEFTTNPKSTPLWINSITEEIADEYPPKIGTTYKNRGESSQWEFYKVIEFENNKVFTLMDLNENYHVRYTYKILDNNTTELEYFEWMTNGELKNPFTPKVLQKLKYVMEKPLI